MKVDADVEAKKELHLNNLHAMWERGETETMKIQYYQLFHAFDPELLTEQHTRYRLHMRELKSPYLI